ncbi:MAG: endonuclease III domain-containing protein [Roseiflexaceae bacterium]
MNGVRYNGTMEIDTALNQLITHFGEVHWQPHRDGMSALIQTILSHQTTDRNSSHAFDILVHAMPDWASIHALTIQEISTAIRIAGLAHKKAQYILTALDVVAQLDPPYNIDFLASLPPQDAVKWLTQIPGIGPKTAACVLLFAYGMPVTPVDTHIARICRRLQFTTQQTAVAIQAELEHRVSDPDKLAFHLLFIRLGREICHAQRPECARCPLHTCCPSAALGGVHG